MKKEQPTSEQHALASKIVRSMLKQEKENVIVFKKKNSGKVARSNKDPISDQEIEHGRLNGSLRPKPQLPSQESVKSEKLKGLPVLSLAGASAGKKLMIQKALLEYAKNLPPSNPYQEKEALQQETLQLKQKNNELATENIRLKTKLMTVEKENLRLQRAVDEDRMYPTKDISTAASGVRPSNSSKSVEQTLYSLKGLLRDTRKELDELRDENGKIKKSVKYTRINELQQQKKSYFEETVRLRQLLEEQFSENIQHKMKEHDMSGLEHKMMQLQDSNHLLRKQNSELSQKLKKSEEKIKGYTRFNETEKNMNRVILGLKKTIKDKETEIQSLKKDMKESRDVSVKDVVLEEKEKQREKERERIKVSSAPKHRPDLKSNPLNPLAHHHHPLKCQNCAKWKSQISKLNEQIKKLDEQLKKKDEAIEILKNKPPTTVKSTVKKPTAELLKNVADFLSFRFKAHHLPIESTETYLFKKDQIKEGEQPSTTTTVGNMIEVLLTEPFFITNSEYLEGLVVHLFYGERTEEEFEIDENLSKPNSELFQIFSTLVGEYSIMEAKKEQEMFIQIAELVTNYCQHISAAFDSKRNGEGTINRVELCAFLNQIELEKEYIDFIITQIILESVDLEHLNYFALFEIFYLPVQEEAQQPGGPGSKMLGIEGQVKELDEEYEDSQSHNNDVDEYAKKGSHQKKASGFRNRQDKSVSVSKKEHSQSKVEEDYYEDFDDQEPPVEKKQLRKSEVPEDVHEEPKNLEEQEQYSADYQM